MKNVFENIYNTELSHNRRENPQRLIESGGDLFVSPFVKYVVVHCDIKKRRPC